MAHRDAELSLLKSEVFEIRNSLILTNQPHSAIQNHKSAMTLIHSPIRSIAGSDTPN